MIIAIKEQDKVVVGYTNTDKWARLTDKDYLDQENCAIRFTENGTLFACPIMDRTSDLLLYNDELLGKEITPKTIVREIIPKIKELLKQNNRPIEEDGNWKNALYICNNEHLYHIDTHFRFSEVEDYMCNGYCVETLKSVLDDTIGLPAKERIIKAVSFASKLHKENLFPLIITDTKTKQFKYIFKGENIGEHYTSL